MTEPSMPPMLSDALDRLWRQFLPQIEERVATLEAAAQDLASDGLTDDKRNGAQAAAHKLAGVLGTFGLTKGTILAREAEILWSGGADPASAAQLTSIAEQLRALINSRA